MNATRRLCLMLFCLTALLAAVAGFNWYVDPYAAWGRMQADRVAIRKFPERVAAAYRLRHEQPATLLIGASRLAFGMPIEYAYRNGILSAALPGATLDEMAIVLRAGLANPQLKRLIWDVDFCVFSEFHAGLPEADFVRRLARDPRVLIPETLLSLDAFDDSRTLFLRLIGVRRRLAPNVLPIPWPQDVIRDALQDYRQRGVEEEFRASVEPVLREWGPAYDGFRISSGRWAIFRDMLARAREAGIEIIVFVPPMSEYELEVVRQSGQWQTFERWKRALAQETPYWDFTGYGELAAEEDFFFDPVHFKPGLGHLLLRKLLDEDCGDVGPLGDMVSAAGVGVDGATIESHLADQDAARRRRLLEASPQREAVARLRRVRARPEAGESDETGSLRIASP